MSYDHLEPCTDIEIHPGGLVLAIGNYLLRPVPWGDVRGLVLASDGDAVLVFYPPTAVEVAEAERLDAMFDQRFGASEGAYYPGEGSDYDAADDAAVIAHVAERYGELWAAYTAWARREVDGAGGGWGSWSGAINMGDVCPPLAMDAYDAGYLDGSEVIV